MAGLDPNEVLDNALAHPTGMGALFEFINEEERERFRWRLYSAMSTEARLSRRELDPTSAGWGRHPWGDILVSRRGKCALWIGRRLDKAVKVTQDAPGVQVTQDALQEAKE